MERRDIIVLVDNSPAAMILPTRFFDFVQEANDFYFPPLVGSLPPHPARGRLSARALHHAVWYLNSCRT